MKTIAKIINWKGKEYAYVIENKSMPFCDFCIFKEECSAVLSKKILYEGSPMEICERLSVEFNTNFANFEPYEIRR